MPALRRHASDIPALVRHFVYPMSIEEEGLSLLCDCPWPGNVRQLKSTIESLKLRASATMSGLITTDQVHRELRMRRHVIRRQGTITPTITLREGVSLDSHFARAKLEVYKDMLGICGSHSGVAAFFGENRKGLHHKIRRWERQINSESGEEGD